MKYFLLFFFVFLEAQMKGSLIKKRLTLTVMANFVNNSSVDVSNSTTTKGQLDLTFSGSLLFL